MSSPDLAFLFPGQGSQAVGMGKALYDEISEVRPLFEAASDAAGLDVIKLMFKGPLPALSRTAVLQPAITAVNLACLHFLRSRGIEPGATAGHSLGEYSALACAGVVTPEAAVRLTAERGRLMTRAAEERPGMMYAVIGLQADEVIAELEGLFPRERGGVANLNAPSQVVISGEPEAMKQAVAALKARRTRAVKLNVSGAWHSELMATIEDDFAAVLDRVEFSPPKIKLFLNVSGEAVEDPEEIRSCLKRQLRNRVRWIEIQRGLTAAGVTRFVEAGPGRVLRGLLRRTLPDPEAYQAHCAGDLHSLEQVAETLADRC